jgi:hypothetical protein
VDARPTVNGLVIFFSAAQIAPRFFSGNFYGIYFFTIFPSKNGHFMNQPALGIGIA